MYSLETGISIVTIEGYFNLLIEAGIYTEPDWYLNSGKLLMPEEHQLAWKKYEQKKEEQRKKKEEEEERFSQF